MRAQHDRSAGIADVGLQREHQCVAVDYAGRRRVKGPMAPHLRFQFVDLCTREPL